MKEKSGGVLYKISRIISGFFNPLISLVIFFVLEQSRDFEMHGFLRRFLPLMVIVFLPVIIWISWHVKTGRYTNYDVSNRRQRQSLYVFIEIAMAAYLLAGKFFITKNWDTDFAYLLLLLIVMQVSNFFIKSSMHTAINIFVAALFFVHFFSFWVYCGWMILSVIIGITRIILKKHTPAEVLSGAALGILVSGIMIFFRPDISQNHIGLMLHLSF